MMNVPKVHVDKTVVCFHFVLTVTPAAVGATLAVLLVLIVVAVILLVLRRLNKVFLP